MVSGEVPNFVYDTRTRHLWSCSYGRGGNELCPLPLSRAVQRSRDGTRLQSFPHYAPEWGMYISQDPIRLEAGLTNLYAYVHDTNGWIDPLGLDMIPNKVAGNAREELAEIFIRRKHPKATISKERYIRDATGKSVFDSVSMSRRRLDIVVVENDRVTAIYEVTSPTANKTRQMEKESRIRTLAEGG